MERRVGSREQIKSREKRKEEKRRHEKRRQDMRREERRALICARRFFLTCIYMQVTICSFSSPAHAGFPHTCTPVRRETFWTTTSSHVHTGNLAILTRTHKSGKAPHMHTHDFPSHVHTPSIWSSSHVYTSDVLVGKVWGWGGVGDGGLGRRWKRSSSSQQQRWKRAK